MYRGCAARSALVRFVHSRIGIRPETSVCAGRLISPDVADIVDAPNVVQRLDAGDEDGLAAAVVANRPVVVSGIQVLPSERNNNLGIDWVSHIHSLCGYREVQVRLPTCRADASHSSARTFGDGRARAPYARSEFRRLAEVIDEIRDATVASAVGHGRDITVRRPTCYAACLSLAHVLPELAEELRPLNELVYSQLDLAPLGPPTPGTPVLYLGGGGQRTPLHFDPTEALNVVLQGEKHFRLFSPAMSSQLHANGGSLAAAFCWLYGIVPTVYSGLDAWAPPGAGAHRLPEPLDVVIRAGDALYMPPGWWHAVAGSAEPNISIVYGFSPCSSKGAKYYRR